MGYCKWVKVWLLICKGKIYSCNRWFATCCLLCNGLLQTSTCIVCLFAKSKYILAIVGATCCLLCNDILQTKSFWYQLLAKSKYYSETVGLQRIVYSAMVDCKVNMLFCNRRFATSCLLYNGRLQSSVCWFCCVAKSKCYYSTVCLQRIVCCARAGCNMPIPINLNNLLEVLHQYHVNICLKRLLLYVL